MTRFEENGRRQDLSACKTGKQLTSANMGKLNKHTKQKTQNMSMKKKFKKNIKGPAMGKEINMKGKKKKRARYDMGTEDFAEHEMPDSFMNFTSVMSSEWASDGDDDDAEETIEDILAAKGMNTLKKRKSDDDDDDEEEEEEQEEEERKLSIEGLECLSGMMRERLQKFKDVCVTEEEVKTLQTMLSGNNVNETLEDSDGKHIIIAVTTIELMIKRAFFDLPGTGVVIIVGQADIAKKIEAFIKDFSDDLELSIGVFVDGDQGDSIDNEAAILKKGLDIVIGTVGRLEHHLRNTEGFVYEKLSCLIIDQGDLMGKDKPHRDLKKVLELTEERSQTVFFSRVKSLAVKHIGKLAIQKQAVHGPQEAYIVCPTKRKFQILHSVLETNRRRKVIVFMNTGSEVKFFGKMLYKLDLPVLQVSESDDEIARQNSFKLFRTACAGILLITDKALKNEEFHRVSVVIHFDAPVHVKQYTTRVMYLNKHVESPTSLMLLMKEEESFAEDLRGGGIKLQSISVDMLSIANIQPKMVKLLRCSIDLQHMGILALKHYLRSIKQNVNKMDLEEICFSYGIIVNSGRSDDANIFSHIKDYVSKSQRGELQAEDEMVVDVDGFNESDDDDDDDEDVLGIIGYYKGPKRDKTRRSNGLLYHEWLREEYGEQNNSDEDEGDQDREQDQGHSVASRGGRGRGRGNRGRGRGAHVNKWQRSYDKTEKGDEQDGKQNDLAVDKGDYGRGRGRGPFRGHDGARKGGHGPGRDGARRGGRGSGRGNRGGRGGPHKAKWQRSFDKTESEDTGNGSERPKFGKWRGNNAKRGDRRMGSKRGARPGFEKRGGRSGGNRGGRRGRGQF